MDFEIEKKYLIRQNNKEFATSHLNQLYSSISDLVEDVMQNGKTIHQGYLPFEIGRALSRRLYIGLDFTPVEFRLRNKAGKFLFTIKGYGGLKRNETPDEILSEETFNNYWEFTKGNRIYKKRLKKPYQNLEAELDLFLDRDLILAEVETETEEQANALNPLGKDVSEDQKYKNKNLAK